MDKDQSTETTARGTSARSSELRQRVRAALRAGDRTGQWKLIGDLLDEADAIQRRAQADRQLALELLEAAER